MAEAVDSRTGDKLWDDWDRPPRIPDSPVLHLDGFDGPMDLLLDLAERQRIDLGRISMLQLAEQFIAEAERLAAYVPLERRADWMVEAARLVLLRSRLLSAADPAEAQAVERDATRRDKRHRWKVCWSCDGRRRGSRPSRSSESTCSRGRSDRACESPPTWR